VTIAEHHNSSPAPYHCGGAGETQNLVGCSFALFSIVEGNPMASLKTPLGRRELDALTLSTEAALAEYKEQRRKLQAGRKTRDERKPTNLTQPQSSSDDEIV
jgi:hypothetical protein